MMQHKFKATSNTMGRFLDACNLKAVDTTPVWLMRQAGRYMRDYRALREKYTFPEIIKSPELAATVTLQPIHAFDVDAAIIFSDNLVPLEAIGLNIEYIPNKGPIVRNAIKNLDDIYRLKISEIEGKLGYTISAIEYSVEMLNSLDKPLIGFAASPFNLAHYALGGNPNHNGHLNHIKAIMHNHPEAWAHLMQLFIDLLTQYFILQHEAGAKAIQVFDAWCGWLSPSDYRAYVLPYTAQLVKQLHTLEIPIIHSAKGSSAMLDDVAKVESHVLGLDWNVDIDKAWKHIGYEYSIQGNLDPSVLLAPWDVVKDRIEDVLDRVGNRKGHIFNLGHGVHPKTEEDQVKRLVDYVHEYSFRRASKTA